MGRVCVRTVCRCNRWPAGSWQIPGRSLQFPNRNWYPKLRKSLKIKNPKKWCPGALRKGPWKQGCKKEHRLWDFGMLLINYVDFWLLLGNPQKPRGRQKRDKKFNTASVGRPKATQRRQKIVFGGVWKSSRFLIDFKAGKLKLWEAPGSDSSGKL